MGLLDQIQEAHSINSTEGGTEHASSNQAPRIKIYVG